MRDLNKLNGKEIPSFLSVICGTKDHGKSTFVKEYLLPKMAAIKPVVILDMAGDYPYDFMHEGTQEFFKHLAENGGIKTGIHNINWINYKQDPIQLLEWVAEQGRGRDRKLPISLILDEGHILFGKSLKKYIEEPFSQGCFMGAHFGMDTVICTQRPYSLSPDVRSQADFMVSFKLKEPADLEYLRKKQESPDNVVEVVANLNKYEFFSIGDRPQGLDAVKINEINKLDL